MKIIVGLGNPGAKYRSTRHNVGYLILSELAVRLAAGSKPKARFHADMLDISYRGEQVLFLCPTTFMNRSGTSVSEAVRFYKLPPENVLVICDDFNIPFAKLRFRTDGSAGGQKGLADIIRLLGTDKIPRMRFGIGPPGEHQDAADFVLADFNEAEKKALPLELKRAADAVECFLSEGLTEAMNRFNGTGQ